MDDLSEELKKPIFVLRNGILLGKGSSIYGCTPLAILKLQSVTHQKRHLQFGPAAEQQTELSDCHRYPLHEVQRCLSGSRGETGRRSRRYMLP